MLHLDLLLFSFTLTFAFTFIFARALLQYALFVSFEPQRPFVCIALLSDVTWLIVVSLCFRSCLAELYFVCFVCTLKAHLFALQLHCLGVDVDQNSHGRSRSSQLLELIRY